VIDDHETPASAAPPDQAPNLQGIRLLLVGVLKRSRAFDFCGIAIDPERRPSRR